MAKEKQGLSSFLSIGGLHAQRPLGPYSFAPPHIASRHQQPPWTTSINIDPLIFNILITDKAFTLSLRIIYYLSTSYDIDLNVHGKIKATFKQSRPI